MNAQKDPTYSAFVGDRRVASGNLSEVAGALWRVCEADPRAFPLVFDDVTSEPVEIDLRGGLEDVLGRLDAPSEAVARGPGRPKLGVVGREVTLLPRHWDWLASQPGGASVALRKLVEEARRASEAGEARRGARDSAYRFMAAIAGNAPDYDEAARALFAGDTRGFLGRIALWPADIRAHLERLVQPMLEGPQS